MVCRILMFMWSSGGPGFTESPAIWGLYLIQQENVKLCAASLFSRYDTVGTFYSLMVGEQRSILGPLIFGHFQMSWRTSCLTGNILDRRSIHHNGPSTLCFGTIWVIWRVQADTSTSANTPQKVKISCSC